MANSDPNAQRQKGTFKLKAGLAQMLKGGVIMDVVTPEHARMAEEAGACAVMALERVPADIRAHGGVARMSDPTLIRAIKEFECAGPFLYRGGAITFHSINVRDMRVCPGKCRIQLH